MKIDKNLNFKEGVYMLHINEHLYVGSSINLYRRLCVHNRTLTIGKHENIYLQRAYNKYGSNYLWYEILEFCQNMSVLDLRKRELFYIEKYNADLNLKRDPTTEYNCITTSIKVYQYNYKGELIKEWPSAAEAARFYKVSNSNIECCCKNPTRQRESAGFLWAREYPYPFKLTPFIRVYDLEGNFIDEYKNTVAIAKIVYKDKKQKSVLSMLKKRINSNIPYCNYYLTTDINFSVTPQMKKRYRKETALDKILKSNPLIYVYDKSFKLLRCDYLKNLPHQNVIRRDIKKGTSFKYSLIEYTPDNYCTYERVRKHKCLAQDIFTGEIYIFNTRAVAAIDLFGDKRFYKDIYKHIKRKTPFRGFRFRDL